MKSHKLTIRRLGQFPPRSGQERLLCPLCRLPNVYDLGFMSQDDLRWAPDLSSCSKLCSVACPMSVRLKLARHCFSRSLEILQRHTSLFPSAKTWYIAVASRHASQVRSPVPARRALQSGVSVPDWCQLCFRAGKMCVVCGEDGSCRYSGFILVQASASIRFSRIKQWMQGRSIGRTTFRSSHTRAVDSVRLRPVFEAGQVGLRILAPYALL